MDNFEGPLLCPPHHLLMAIYSNIMESILNKEKQLSTSYLYKTQINKVVKNGFFSQLTFAGRYRLGVCRKDHQSMQVSMRSNICWFKRTTDMIITNFKTLFISHF